MVSFRRHRPEREQDEAIRQEMLKSIDNTRALRDRIHDQWDDVMEITKVTQPRLLANGFTEAVAAVVHSRRSE